MRQARFHRRAARDKGGSGQRREVPGRGVAAPPSAPRAMGPSFMEGVIMDSREKVLGEVFESAVVNDMNYFG